MLQSKVFGLVHRWFVENQKKKHFNECYFCLVDLKRFNRRKKKTRNYPDLESVRRPVPHCEEVPTPEFSNLSEVSMDYEFHEEVEGSATASDSGGSVFESSSSIPDQFMQELSDLNLSKAAEILASRLKNKSCLRTGASITFYHTRQKELLSLLEISNSALFKPPFSFYSFLRFCVQVVLRKLVMYTSFALPF